MEIYAVRISDISEEKLDELNQMIYSVKKYDAKKLIDKKDKIRTLIGEILIRTIIIEKLKIKNKTIVFNKNKYGKPYLEEWPNFNFNISHSGNYVLCVVDNEPIGIDVEEVKNIEYREIAKNFFTIKEFDYIFNQDFKFQLNRFYEMWVLKESYIKCLGKGLSIPLNSFCIEINQCQDIKVLINNEYKEHRFKIFDLELNYKVAVCSANNETSNNIIRIEQKKLISKYFRLNFE